MTTPSVTEFKRAIVARMDVRDWRGAAAEAEACRGAYPADPAGWLLGSFVALLSDQREAALALIDGGLAAQPKDLACLIQRAECLFTLGRRGEAIAAAETAATVAGDEPAALNAVAAFLVHANEHARALRLYDRAIAAAPQDAALLTRRAAMHRSVGAFAEALADLDRVLAIDPADAEALKARGELRRQSAEHSSVDALAAALARNPSDPEHAVPLHFALAKAYEDAGEYAESWRHLRAANGLERTRVRYDATLDRVMTDGMIAAFPGPEPQAPDTTGESPIFIVGLPRTGTTLVDTILGSHSQVHSAGELLVFYEAIGGAIARTRPPVDLDFAEYPQLVAGLDGATLAAEYLARVRAWRGDRPRFTDKHVTNFFYIAPILRAFPQARIVHLTRHPLAACYANYKTWFRHGFPYSFDLAELAEFYIGYRRLMAHWHRILPGRILDLAYEDVVTSQEATTRMLLDYCGLPFEAACLEFHANPAPITTASAFQARQPLYDSSLEQWRHYAEGLAPVRQRLAEAGIAVD
ncbi:MAG TPA: sulfotransferase [Steroidobacteraceae bacterium]|nr:sulfotransferase [Steroidobacteraceae bacterium]